MKYNTDITTLLYQALNVPLSITGSIYKDVRPINSTKEDIVINTITTDAELIQDSVCNVNIHIPSLLTQDGKIPNHARIQQVADEIKPYINYRASANYTYFLDQSSLVEDINETWFLNIRIKFKFHNT